MGNTHYYTGKRCDGSSDIISITSRIYVSPTTCETDPCPGSCVLVGYFLEDEKTATEKPTKEEKIPKDHQRGKKIGKTYIYTEAVEPGIPRAECKRNKTADLIKNPEKCKVEAPQNARFVWVELTEKGEPRIKAELHTVKVTSDSGGPTRTMGFGNEVLSAEQPDASEVIKFKDVEIPAAGKVILVKDNGIEYLVTLHDGK
jgi:hypothetical protein